MNAIPLEDPTEALAAFVAAHGKDKIDRCYFTPMERMKDESMWEFFDEEGHRVAWGGMRRIFPHMYGYRLGVYPAFERRGWRLQIRDWLVAKAFEDPAVSIVRTSCQIGNPSQVVRMLNGHLSGEWMELASATMNPRPTIYFHMTRERWEQYLERKAKV